MNFNRFITPSLILTAMGSLYSTAAPAQAAMILTITTAGQTSVVLDNNIATGDSQPATGVITNTDFFIGYFNFVVTIGTSNSPGSASGDILQVTSINVRNTTTGPQNLKISLSDNDFSSSGGPAYVLASSLAATITGGLAGDSVNFQSFADPSNLLNGQTIATNLQTGTLATASLMPVSLGTPDHNTPFISGVPFSISNELSITLSAGAEANVSASTTVSPAPLTAPEPASLALLGLGAMGLMARRRT